MIGTWQVEHMQTHKYFQAFQPPMSDPEPETDTALGVNHTSSGILDNSNMTLMNPLPPAGNLIVHDKGKKSSQMII